MIERLTNILPNPDNAMHLGRGLLIGALGAYAVKKFKEPPCQIQLQPMANFHILQLDQKEPIFKQISLAEFKNTVTVDELNTLRQTVSWAGRTPQIWSAVFAASDDILCVKKADTLVGYVALMSDNRYGVIRDMLVRGDHQRNGIGTKMLNHLVSIIKSKGLCSVGLFGWSENPGALDFYANFGFTNTAAMEASADELHEMF